MPVASFTTSVTVGTSKSYQGQARSKRAGTKKIEEKKTKTQNVWKSNLSRFSCRSGSGFGFHYPIPTSLFSRWSLRHRIAYPARFHVVATDYAFLNYVKVACSSTRRTLSSYCLLFSCSCLRYTEEREPW